MFMFLTEIKINVQMLIECKNFRYYDSYWCYFLSTLRLWLLFTNNEYCCQPLVVTVNRQHTLICQKVTFSLQVKTLIVTIMMTTTTKYCHTLKARVVVRSVSKPVYIDQMMANAGCWELDKTLASMRISFMSSVNDIILDSTLATSAFHQRLSRDSTPRTAFTTVRPDL